MIDAVAQLGILMLLLITGMETDLSVVGRLRRTALGVSVTGISIPFGCRFALGEMLPATNTHLDILVPVIGTQASQRGAEIAMALARAGLGSVTVLQVARRSDRQGGGRFRAAWGGPGASEDAVLKDAVRLGDHFGVPIRTAARRRAAAETAILSQLRGGEHNLSVMGVNPRPGPRFSSATRRRRYSSAPKSAFC
jgi:hypothetical protein